MNRLLVLILASMLAGASGVAAPEAASEDQDASLKRYLASMSWPLRASTARAHTISQTINAWLRFGDPPFLGQVGANCRSLRAVERSANRAGSPGIFAAQPTAGLRAEHADVRSAYAKARAGCRRARLLALAARASTEAFAADPTAAAKRVRDRATAAARKELASFRRKTLRSFEAAVRRWRAAVLRQPAVSHVPHAWVNRLGTA